MVQGIGGGLSAPFWVLVFLGTVGMSNFDDALCVGV